MKMLEDLTIENENLKRGNIKVWEQLEKSTEILSHHEAYISLLEEENAQLKELLRECRELFVLEKGFMVKCIREEILSDIIAKIDEVLK